MANFKDGDLVVVYRTTHPCAEALLGKIFVYRAAPYVGIHCPRCDKRNIIKRGQPISFYDDRAVVAASWLKLIPPLPQETDTCMERDLERTA